MKLKDMHIEELELMSYTDMTYMILKENNKAMNTPTIFKEICNLFDYSEEEYMAKIGDYYTSLTLDKRFVLLENNEWDIRDRHSVELILDDDDTLENDSEEENGEEFEEEIEEDLDDMTDMLEDDLGDADIDDLEIVTDDDLDEEN